VASRSSIPPELSAALERGRDVDPRCGELPWDGFDDHTVPQVLEGVGVWIDEADLSHIENVLFYEDAQKARKAIVSACIDALDDAGQIMPFWQRIRGVFELSCPNARAKLVLVALAFHADPFGRCWPKVARLAQMTCDGEYDETRDLRKQREARKRTVRRALKELETAGYLRREYRQKESGVAVSTLYVLTMPEGQEVGANTPSLADEPAGWGQIRPQGEGIFARGVGAQMSAIEQPEEQPEERSTSTSPPVVRKPSLKEAIQSEKKKGTKRTSTKERPKPRPPQLADTHAGATTPGLSVVPDPPRVPEHSKRGEGKYAPTGSDDTPSLNGHERALTSGELRRAWKDQHGT